MTTTLRRVPALRLPKAAQQPISAQPAPVRSASQQSAQREAQGAFDLGDTPSTPPAPAQKRLGRLGSLIGNSVSESRSHEYDHVPDHPSEPQQPAAPGMEEVKVKIVKSIYETADGFAIYVVKPRIGNEFTLSLTSPTKFDKGDKIVAQGEWGKYRGKPTFKAAGASYEVAKGAKGIVAWLKSKAVSGVGPGTAEKLAEFFGDDLQSVIDKPEELAKAGIPLAKAQAIGEAWWSGANQPQLIALLAKHGLGPTLIGKVIRRYGAAAKRIVEENPWALVETIDGIGFETADNIAASAGLVKTSVSRIRAGLKHVLTEKCAREGHCGLPRGDLAESATSLLKLPRTLIDPEVNEMLDGRSFVFDDEVGLAYSAQMHSAERRLAERFSAMVSSSSVRRIARSDAEQAVDKAAYELDIRLDPSQREAAVTAISNGLSIITGGPGTGKSTSQKVVVHALKMFDREITLAAPTGRAAKRLADVSGMPASTLHRLLQYSTEKGGFEYDRNNPMDEDWFIIDEFSMVDTRIGSSFFDAISNEACATPVGDINQIPSVGAGQVLRDMITSGIIPVSRLTKTHRTAKDSGITVAAHRINEGLHPIQDPSELMKGFSITDPGDPDAIVQRVIEMLRFEFPERGIDPLRDVQVLASMRKGSLGVHALNDAIKSALNPALENGQSIEIKARKFTVGDRVMHLRNDYVKAVFNGEVGTIKWVGNRRDDEGRMIACVKVDYSGYDVSYTADDIDDIEQAWVATVHKSQGCEFPVVLFICPYEHRRMLTRNLFYTAVTRAKMECYIIGDNSAVEHAVETADTSRRHTGLVQRLQPTNDNEEVFGGDEFEGLTAA